LAQICHNNISIEDEMVQRFAVEIRDLKAKQKKKKPIKISKAKIGMRVILFDSCLEEDERENGYKRNSNTVRETHNGFF
jgi:hypothetical protein